MAGGLFGKAALAAGAATLVAAAAGDNTIVNILLANRSATATVVQVWITTATIYTGIADADVLVPTRALKGYAEYEKNAISLSAGENVWIQDLNGTVTAQVRGVPGGG